MSETNTEINQSWESEEPRKGQFSSNKSEPQAPGGLFVIHVWQKSSHSLLTNFNQIPT